MARAWSRVGKLARRSRSVAGSNSPPIDTSLVTSLLVVLGECLEHARGRTRIFLRERKDQGPGQACLHALEVSTFDRPLGQGVLDDAQVDALFPGLLS